MYLKVPDKCETLDKMVEFELKMAGKEKIRGDKQSGTIGCVSQRLWWLGWRCGA